MAQPQESGLHKKLGFSVRQAAHGWLVAGAVTALSVALLAAASAREVIDAAGRKVQVPDRVERVVAAGPPASVLVVMLAPEKLVGWNLKPRDSELVFLPPVVRNLPEVGRLTGRGGTTNLEVIMAAKPDVIDAPPSVNRMLGLQWLAWLFFPDRFPSDIRGKTRKFYKLFYQVDVNDAQLDGLLERSR